MPKLTPLFDSSFDHRVNFFQLVGRINRPNISVFIHWVAKPQAIHPSLKFSHELVMNGLLDQQSAPRAANMALVEEYAVYNTLDRLIDWRIVKDNVGRLASKFQGDLFSTACNLLGNQLSYLG